MHKFLARGLVALAVGSLGLVSTASSEAQAVTWTRTTATSQNAYSWNGYKAKVGPSAAPAVSGYAVYDKRISVKNSSGTTLASNVTSRWTSPGTYTVYSTFKYRKAWPYTATKTVTYGVNYSNLNSCTLTDVSGVTYGSGPVTASCSVTLSDYNGNSATKTLPVTGDYYGLDDPYVGQQTTDIYNYEVSLPSTFSKTVSYTAYKYTYTTRYRVRTAKVVKVTNYASVTWNEYKTISAPWAGGDSLTRVRSIFGSNGTRTYFSDSNGTVYTSYRWANTSGGYVYVIFQNYRAYSKDWYS